MPVLSDHKDRCAELVRLLSIRGINALMLTGDLSQQERQRSVKALKDGQAKVLVGTWQLCGEGFDFPELSTLFLVYDYVDNRIGVLRNAVRERKQVYKG